MTEQTSELEAAVLAAQEAVARQGDIVRSLKADAEDGKVVRVRVRVDHVLADAHRCFGMRGTQLG